MVRGCITTAKGTSYKTMGETTAISWTHHTQNLWWGCEKVSPACDHCYAERDSKRYGFDVWGLDKPRRFFKPEHYDAPLGWNAKAERLQERRRVFVNSMSDIFERHPDEIQNNAMNAARRDYFERVVPRTPWLDHLLLTKRPTNVREMVPRPWLDGAWPRNVWLGGTAENEEWLRVLVPILVRYPAPVIYVSYEPALGPIADELEFWAGLPGAPLVNWVIAGGESGAKFRDADLQWYRDVRDVCADRDVAFWFKQHSGLHPRALGDLPDGRQHHELPEVRA